MRKVIYSMNVSLDGFIEDAAGSLGWTNPDPELHKFFNDQEREIGLQLYGRRLYELMASYWPTAEADPAATPEMLEYAQIWRSIPKVVVSRTLEHVGPDARLVRDDVAGEVRRLKAEPGKAILVGGPGLAATLMQHDLIDEYRPVVLPVLLGGGKPMFPPQGRPANLRLIETRRFHSGAVLLSYTRADVEDRPRPGA